MARRLQLQQRNTCMELAPSHSPVRRRRSSVARQKNAEESIKVGEKRISVVSVQLIGSCTCPNKCQIQGFRSVPRARTRPRESQYVFGGTSKSS
jgi:hypothetical protein